MFAYKIDCFDLETSEVYKVNVVIKAAGGRYSLTESIKRGGSGVRGLAYYRKNNDLIKLGNDDIKQTVNIELLKNGLLFYLRSRYSNYSFVLENSWIKSITLHKNKDEILQNPGKIYNMLLAMGVDYLLARRYILDDQIISLYPIQVLIELIDGRKINLEIDRFNPKKVINFIDGLKMYKIHNTIEF